MLEEGDEVGYRRAEGLSAIGEGGQAATSLMRDVDGIYVHTFESLQDEGLYLGDLLYRVRCPREAVRSW